jgi:hypothetical protein
MYRFSIYVENRNKRYIKSHDTICMQAQQENSSTQIQKETNTTKRAFTTNWEIYRVCLPITCEPKTQANINPRTCLPEKLPQIPRTFKELFTETVDQELTFLGDPVKKAVYNYLKKTFKINKDDIPLKIDQFTEAIEEIFGASAALLEIRIMKRFHEKASHDIDYFSEDNDLLFTQYMKAARLSNHSY